MNNGNKNPNRRPLTKEEREARLRAMSPEERRAYEEKRRAYIEKKRAEENAKRATRRKIVLAVIFAATLLIIFGLLAAVISMNLSKADPKAPKVYTFNIGGVKNRVAYADANRGGMLYIDVRSLMNIMGLTESSGRADAVTFTSSRTTKNYVVFTDGSSVCTVNGQNVGMPGPAAIGSDGCFVPLATVSYIFSGIDVSVGTSRITITENGDTIDILAKSTEPLDMIISFQANLEEYEGYMNPKGDSRDKYLLLVNKQNPLGSAYIPSDLVTIDAAYCSNQNANMMTACAAKALEAMLIELRVETGNYSITGTSGYRSYDRQNALFANYIREEMSKGLSEAEARRLVLTYSAEPGTSEHQSGLCMDLVDLTRGGLENYPDTGYFTSAEIYNWLINNAWKFGFILRYPSDKVDVTGYSYESWHFRFVGRYHAQRIYGAGCTLEEYLDTLK